MFICNFKFDKKKFLKIFSITLAILAVTIFIISILKIFNSSKEVSSNTVTTISSNNFTSFLKDAHENISSYVGKRFSISGYVYRMPDFTENEFVIARTMIINSNQNANAVIVGILANSSNVKNFKNNDWVSCVGTIKKGTYKGDMPVLVVDEITKIEVPEDDFVYLP